MKLKFVYQEPVPEVDKLLISLKGPSEKFSVCIFVALVSQNCSLHKSTFVFLLIQDETTKLLSEQTGLNKTQIKRYVWNKHRNEVNERKLTKFSEAMWRAMFYTSFCVLGYVTLCLPDYVPWFRNTEDHWNNWPHHPISRLLNFYYQIELGCYLHQLHWTEVSRSDAFEMILHHCITITLIVSSYLQNFTRVGSSILLVHDFADIFLEVGKCFNYTSKTPEYKAWASKITDALFAAFALSFLVTRLILYPRFMVYSVLVEAPAILGMWPGYWLTSIMLSALQCLHVFWFYLIARMAYRIMIVGEVEKDVRSDDEEEAEVVEDDREGDKKEN